MSGEVIRKWWDQNRSDDGHGRAFAARMRRAGSVAEVLSMAEVLDLSKRLGGDLGPYRLALVAQSVALVKENGKLRLAAGLGGADPDKRALSELRFRRLVTAPDDDALRLAIRRVLPMVNHACDVAALGEDLRFWGERKASDWCFDYYGAPRPGDEISKEEGET